MPVVLPRNVTVTVGGASFKTKTLRNYAKTKPLLVPGQYYLTAKATVHVKRENLYEVTMDDGEFNVVYRDPTGKLIGDCYAVEAVIAAEASEWTKVRIGARH